MVQDLAISSVAALSHHPTLPHNRFETAPACSNQQSCLEPSASARSVRSPLLDDSPTFASVPLCASQATAPLAQTLTPPRQHPTERAGPAVPHRNCNCSARHSPAWRLGGCRAARGPVRVRWRRPTPVAGSGRATGGPVSAGAVLADDHAAAGRAGGVHDGTCQQVGAASGGGGGGVSNLPDTESGSPGKKQTENWSCLGGFCRLWFWTRHMS